MNRSGVTTYIVVLLVLLLQFSVGAAAPAGETALKASDISGKIFPEHVFFRGQVAPVQMRNTGGVHFADDAYVMAGMVDSSG